MLKIYKTVGSLAVKIPMEGGGAKQVVFDPANGDKSIYVTREESVQRSLERFHLFGKVYFLDKEVDEEKIEEERKAKAAEVAKAAAEAAKVYDVVSLQEARNILIDEYNVNNSEIRGKAKTLAKAAELGVTFNGLE